MEEYRLGMARGRGRGQDTRQPPVPSVGRGASIPSQFGMRSMQLPQPNIPVLGANIEESIHPPALGRAQRVAAMQPKPAKPVQSLTSDEDRRESKERGSLRGRRDDQQIVITKPKNIVTKMGQGGTAISLQANYFALRRKPSWNIFQYRVDFQPDVYSDGLRKWLVRSIKSELGGYLFDGTQLFVIKRIGSHDQEQRRVTVADGGEYTITMRFTKEVSMTDSASLQVLNLILRHAMQGLRLQLVGRNFFDPDARARIPEFKIELWPGYATSIRQHEQQIMLCTEITHKVMRMETIHDIMMRVKRDSRDFRSDFLKEVLGTIVLTDYNNRTYRIDDINFELKASDVFDTKTGQMSYVEYYRVRYNIHIRDHNQPLIMTKAKQKDLRGGRDDTVMLIPELCRATGITDRMRNDFQTMRAVSDYTRMNPANRIKRLLDFNRRLVTTNESMAVLRDWGLELSQNLVEVPGRHLDYENIIFGNGYKHRTTATADWSTAFRNNAMYETIALKRWYLIVPQSLSMVANEFLALLRRSADGMKFEMFQPRISIIPNDRQSTYVEELEKCANQNPQLIMCVVPNSNADRYANIKKKCCLDRTVATQVLVAKTITPRSGKPIGSLMSVATKVNIQMNCKLGGSAWMIDLPVNGLMTIGYDVCHDAQDKRKSYGALVATMDLKKRVQFFSVASAHTNGEELSNQLTLNVRKALQEYRSINHTLPMRIVIYRDGVGDGQIHYVVEHELKRLMVELGEVYETAGIKDHFRMAFIIVSKRINTRLFLKEQNPLPGTVVDDTITLPERYDFFLISQSIRQGTVMPTSYNVIYDNLGWTPEKVQWLTHKQTHLYYNANGTVRVPAVCQYAHKLAFLISQSIHTCPENILNNQLYYL